VSVSSGRTIEQIFGDRLRQLRLERNLSQEKLAELARLHRNYIGHLERGEKTPSLVVLLRISDALSVSVGTLLSDFITQAPSTR
jgi:transcriptional regulator with XRE-family HTH domain